MARKPSSEANPRRLDGYMRVSDVRGRKGDSYMSLPLQRAQIERWAATHNGEIVRWWEEEDVSGGTLRRPMFDQVMARCESGETDGFVVAKLDRLTRLETEDALRLFKQFRKMGIVFGCLEPDIDASQPNTTTGQLVLEQMVSLASYEKRRIGQNWRAAQKRRAASGIAPYRATYGYRAVCVKCGGRVLPSSKKQGRLRAQCERCGELGSGKFMPDPVTGPVVTEIWERRAAGETLALIRHWLIAEDIPTPSGGPPEHWTIGQLSAILRRANTYLGHISVGDELFEDKHPALIDPATARAAQAGTRTIGLGPRRELLLRGLARCAGCRSTLTRAPLNRGGGPGASATARRSRELRRRVAELYTDGRSSADVAAELGISASYVRRLARSADAPVRNRDDEGYGQHYVCQQSGGHGGCRAKAMVIAESGPRSVGLEDYVSEQLLERLGELEAVAVGGPSRLVEQATVEARQARDKVRQLARDTAFEEQFGSDAFHDRLAAFEAEARQFEQRRDELLGRGERLDRPVRRLADDWQEMDVSERHALLTRLIRAVFVRKPPSDPGKVAEARRLRAEGATYAEVGQRLGVGESNAYRIVNRKGAKGGSNRGATPDRVQIVWADEPPLELPRQGRPGPQKPFVFPAEPQPAAASGELVALAERAYEDYLRKRFPDVAWVVAGGLAAAQLRAGDGGRHT